MLPQHSLCMALREYVKKAEHVSAETKVFIAHLNGLAGYTSCGPCFRALLHALLLTCLAICANLMQSIAALLHVYGIVPIAYLCMYCILRVQMPCIVSTALRRTDLAKCWVHQHTAYVRAVLPGAESCLHARMGNAHGSKC